MRSSSSVAEDNLASIPATKDDHFIKMKDDDDLAMEEEDDRVSKLCFCNRIWAKYDHTFLFVYTVIYANAGLKFLQSLAVQDLFKNYYFLEPS